MFVSLCRLPDRLSGLLLDYLPCRLLDRRPGHRCRLRHPDRLPGSLAGVVVVVCVVAVVVVAEVVGVVAVVPVAGIAGVVVVVGVIVVVIVVRHRRGRCRSRSRCRGRCRWHRWHR